MGNEGMAATLPSFDSPPVTEVYLGIQFSALADFRGVHPGLFWKSISSIYPQWSEHALVPPAFETFGVAGSGPIPQMMFSFQGLAPQMPRFWFESQDGEWLVQIQQDRLFCNWRKDPSNKEYPRYPAVRQRFLSAVNQFSEYLREFKLGEIEINQCEACYTNTLEISDAPRSGQHIDKFLSLWSDTGNPTDKISFEGANLQAQYVAHADDDQNVRVYVTAVPVLRPIDLQQALQLQITARGRPKFTSVASALDLLDVEREMIVQTFKYVTTSEMHDQWGIQNG